MLMGEEGKKKGNRSMTDSLSKKLSDLRLLGDQAEGPVCLAGIGPVVDCYCDFLFTIDVAVVEHFVGDGADRCASGVVGQFPSVEGFVESDESAQPIHGHFRFRGREAVCASSKDIKRGVEQSLVETFTSAAQVV